MSPYVSMPLKFLEYMALILDGGWNKVSAKKDKVCKWTYGSLKNSKHIYLVEK